MQAGAECDMDDFDMSGLDDAALPAADFEFGDPWPGTGPIGNESPASTDIGDGMQTDDSEPGAGTDAAATATAVSARSDINDGNGSFRSKSQPLEAPFPSAAMPGRELRRGSGS